MHDKIGCILLGDLNVHHARWLYHSSGVSPEGRLLKEVCDTHGLLQIVREPTRNQYLLDSCLTDIARCKCKVGPQIADHRIIVVSTPIARLQSKTIEREVWFFQKAAWNNLRCELQNIDWTFLHTGEFNSTFDRFQDCFMALLETYIPRDTINEVRSNHPWLNDRCKMAIAAKKKAEGSPAHMQAHQSCSEILHEEHREYVRKLRMEIAALSKSDKRWWSLNRELLNRQARMTRLSPLKDDHGWVTDSKAKVDLLSTKWQEKFVLPTEIDDPYFGGPNREMRRPIILRTRSTQCILKSLDIRKATGSDRIGARILKALANELAIPLTILFRRMLHEGCWPSRWKLHFLVPIFKRDSSFLP